MTALYINAIFYCIKTDSIYSVPICMSSVVETYHNDEYHPTNDVKKIKMSATVVCGEEGIVLLGTL